MRTKRATARLSLAAGAAALLALAWAAGPAAGYGHGGLTAHEQRARLLEMFREDREAAAPELEKALEAEPLFVRRTAAHLLVRVGEPAQDQLETALENDDFEVRAIAVRGLAEMGLLPFYAGTVLLDEHPTIRRIVQILLEDHPIPEGEAMEAFVGELASVYEPDAPEAVRRNAVQFLTALPTLDQRGVDLLAEAAGDEAEDIRKEAYKRLFELVDLESARGREILAQASEDDSMDVREMAFQAAWERPTEPFPEDVELRQVKEFFLPAEEWSFRLDEERHGHERGWFEPGYDDGEWRDIEIEGFWHEFIGDRYIGVAWYRRTFEAPDFPEDARVFLHFSGVDECGWIWLNGEYAGQHNIGSIGWDVPFHLDATGLVRPGEENHIAVRVMNTAGAGGIWRPASLRIFEEAEAQ